MSDAWDEYLARQRAGQPATMQPTGQSQPFSFASLFNRGAAAGNVPPGGVPRPNAQGLYTPSLALQPAGPPAPIDYGRMRAILNSGVMRTGEMPDAAMQPNGGQPDAPPAPAPAPAKKTGWEALLAGLFGG